MDSDALTQLEVHVAIPLLIGLVGIGLAWVKKQFNLQVDSTDAQLDAVANAAIQSAIGNFAGKVAGALAAGTLTQATAVTQLQAYLQDTVADSVARFPLSDTALTTMLLGKAAAIAGVQPPAVTP